MWLYSLSQYFHCNCKCFNFDCLLYSNQSRWHVISLNIHLPPPVCQYTCLRKVVLERLRSLPLRVQEACDAAMPSADVPKANFSLFSPPQDRRTRLKGRLAACSRSIGPKQAAMPPATFPMALRFPRYDAPKPLLHGHISTRRTLDPRRLAA